MAKAKVEAGHKDDLKRIKQNVNDAYMYFRNNVERFHEWQKYVFQSTLTATEEAALQGLQKTVIEFNIINSPISRLVGEYSKQQPKLYTEASEGFHVDEMTLKVVQGYLKHILFGAAENNGQNLIYRDQLSGGYSNWKIYTDYLNDQSFEQGIFLTRCDKPTLVFYDPMASKSTKSDAQYWFEAYHKGYDEFKEEYPDVDIKGLEFPVFGVLDTKEFAWSYSTSGSNKKYVVMVDYYEKKYKKTKIFKLANREVVTEEKYKEMKNNHEFMNYIHQMPAIVDTRITSLCYVCRYICINDKVINYTETEFMAPNYVFVDGDSAVIKKDSTGSLQQFTKPYPYHAKGIQTLTNLSGQAIATDLENMTMHKFIVAQEALPDQEEFLEPYRNTQNPANLIYKKYADNDPTMPNDPPMPVPRVGLPPEVTQQFNNCMQMLENILGNYDSRIGTQNGELSGEAVVESATQSNAAAMPYLVNNMQALTQVGQVIADILPKFLITPRTIPIIDEDGKRAFVSINGPEGISINYAPGALKITIEAGVAFAVAKDRAMKQIIGLMKVSPLFAQFINEEGLEILLDNLEFHGVEIVKQKAEEFVKKAQQQQQKPSPDEVTAQARMLDAQTNAKKQASDAKIATFKTMIDAKNAESTEKEADTDRLKALTAIGENQQKLELDASKVQAEEDRTRADVGMEISKHQADMQESEHKQLMDILSLASENNNKDKDDNKND